MARRKKRISRTYEVDRGGGESPDTPSRHKRLLTCASFPKIGEDLRKPDCNVTALARFLLRHDPAFQGMKLESVIRMLRRYRRDLTFREICDGVRRAAIEQEVIGHINEIRELEWLVYKQRQRIERLMELEQQTGKLLSQAPSEIEQARRLAEALIEAKGKLGIYETVPEKLAVLQKSEVTLRDDTQDASRQLAERLRRMGWSDERIAALLGITPNRVARVLELHRVQ